MKEVWKKLYALAVLVFLYAPIAVLVAQSFNASRYRGHWTGFTFHWYRALFENEEILEAFGNTMLIAFISSAAATLIAILSCLAAAAMKKRGRLIVTGTANVSMLNADIVTGISLMMLFLAFGLRFGFGTVLLSHIIFNVPYALLNILPGVLAMDKASYESALDLGATPFRAFMYVTVPEIMPGVISGFLMAFTMSADDFIITHFTKGPGVDTLPTKIYAELKIGIKPEMYALTTLMTGALFLLLILLRINRKHSKSLAQSFGSVY